MQFPTFLIESLKSGKITISEKNIPQIEIKAGYKRLNIDIKDKQLIKEALSSADKGSTRSGLRKRLEKASEQIKAIEGARPLLKDMVEDLCKEGVTIYIDYKNGRVVTVGSEANSKIARFITGTKGVEINNPLKLAQLALKI